MPAMWGLQKNEHVYIAIGAVVVVIALVFSVFVPSTDETPAEEIEMEAETVEEPEPTVVEKVEEIVSAPTPPPPTSTETCAVSFEAEFRCLVNDHRQANGSAPLSADPVLNVVALKHSKWMSANNNPSHVGEGGSEFWERCQAAGSDCFGENVAYGFHSPQELFGFWRNSPPHNENLLDSRFTHMGFGMAGSDTYATTVFR